MARSNWSAYFVSLALIPCLSAVAGGQDSAPEQPQPAPSGVAELTASAEAGSASACWLLYRVYTDAIYDDAQVDPELTGSDLTLWPKAHRAVEETKHVFSPEPAVKWLRRGVELNSRSCMDELGGLLECGRYDGVPMDQSRAIELYQKAAAAGYYLSMVALANHYGAGTCGLKKDPERAAELRGMALPILQRAVERGDARAKSVLGGFYRRGYAGLAKDPGREFELNREAAEAGEVVSMAIVGWALYRGVGVEKSEEEGIRWLRRGVDRKGPYAMYLFACLMGDGKVEGSAARAGELFVESAKRGVPIAMYVVGRGHTTGEWGLPIDSHQAKKWLRRAADGGEVEAMCDLGCIAYKGWERPADSAEAADWFRRAADLDHAESMRMLSGMYLRGEGVEEDASKAVALLKRSVELGSVEAKYDLAACYVGGIGGVPKDADRARELLKESADGGSERARRKLKAVQNPGPGT